MNPEETTPNRLRYNAQTEDELTGLYYLRARYYAPDIGRFTQEDVIYNDGLNLYAYCNSNPVMYSDPSGFAKETCKSKVGGECGSESGSKADVLAQNRVNGRAFEQQEFAKFSSQNSKAVEQITVKTPSGVRTRVDAIGLDTNGNVVINEYKSSLTAPLTDNQKIAFPEIFESGATVVGKGKGIFTGGYQIPPGTKVTIIRPE